MIRSRVWMSVLVLLGASVSAHADYVYQYFGLPFDTSTGSNVGLLGPGITVSFSTPSLLPGNDTGAIPVNASNFTITDGNFSCIAEVNCSILAAAINVAAGGTTVTGWNIETVISPPSGSGPQVVLETVGPNCSQNFEAACDYEDLTIEGPGLSNQSSGRHASTVAGTWTVTSSPVPFPGSMPLLLSGVGVLGLTFRRRAYADVPPGARPLCLAGAVVRKKDFFGTLGIEPPIAR